MGRGREPLARSWEDFRGKWDGSTVPQLLAPGRGGALRSNSSSCACRSFIYFTIHQLLKANIAIQTSKGPNTVTVSLSWEPVLDGQVSAGLHRVIKDPGWQGSFHQVTAVIWGPKSGMSNPRDSQRGEASSKKGHRAMFSEACLEGMPTASSYPYVQWIVTLPLAKDGTGLGGHISSHSTVCKGPFPHARISFYFVVFLKIAISLWLH